MDQNNSLTDLLYTPLDVLPPPEFSMEKLNEFILANYDDDGSVYKTNATTMSVLKENYPWNITHVYYNMENNGPGWMNNFDKEFPELANYFNTVLNIPIEEYGHIMMLPIRKGHTGVGFWHTDGDSYGIRMYLEYEHIGKNKLLMKRTKLPYIRKQGFMIPVDENLLQDEEINCTVISNRQWFYLNNIRALHTTWTEVEDSTRIAVFFCSRKDNWPDFFDKTVNLILRSAKKYKEHAVYWSSNIKHTLNKNMLAYMPKTPTTSAVMQKHFDAYKSFIELGGVEVTSDMKVEAKLAVSEKESWEELTQYFSNFKRETMPFRMCDKLLSNDIYNDAKIETLPCILPTSEEDLTPFLSMPVILKPRLSGGGISRSKLAYTIFNTGQELLEAIQSEEPDFFKTQRTSISDGNFYAQHVLQQSVVRKNIEFGQLYTEGFVNGNGELFISSVHEIGFKNSRWTQQLNFDETKYPEILKIREALKLLVAQQGIKNVVFLLQWVRNLANNRWYPTDWQYRLSYNSLWARQYFEEHYCSDLVKFMSDQIPEVTSKSTKSYFQKYITVNTQKSKDSMMMALDDCKVVYAPFPKSKNDDTTKFLFIATGDSFDEAKSNMERFEKIVQCI